MLYIYAYLTRVLIRSLACLASQQKAHRHNALTLQPSYPSSLDLRHFQTFLPFRRPPNAIESTVNPCLASSRLKAPLSSDAQHTSPQTARCRYCTCRIKIFPRSAFSPSTSRAFNVYERAKRRLIIEDGSTLPPVYEDLCTRHLDRIRWYTIPSQHAAYPRSLDKRHLSMFMRAPSAQSRQCR